MTSMSDYLEKALLEHVLRNEIWTPPSITYLAIFTTMPAENGTGGVEVAGGSYGRQTLTFDTAVLGAGTIATLNTVSFTNMPECTVVGGAIMDAETGGNFLFLKALTNPRPVAAGENFNVLAGDLNVALA